MKRPKNGPRVRSLRTTEFHTNGPEQLESRELLTSLPADFAEFQVGSQLSSAPVTILGAPDGRLFISTDNNKDKGEIFVIKNGNLLNRPAVTLNIQSLGEHGMIGMTLDPNFDDNGYLYLMYTTSEGGIHNRLSRFTFSGDTINPNSERILMDFDPLGSGTVHNGGGMAFGNDGKLYVGVGDNQIAEHAESLDTVLGKILRINPDGSIPRDNPFYNRTSGINRAIYAMGVRNPFTMDADPTTGRIFFNDVGPGSYEEINELVRGGDFGWPSQGAGPRAAPGFERAVHFYHHTNDTPGGCAITGGRFNQTQNPDFPDEYTNKYYFSDYCGGWIYSYDLDSGRVEEFASNLEVRPVSPFIGDDGAIYYLSREERGVFKIEYQADNDLKVTRQPEDVQLAAGEDAQFTVSVTGNGSTTYQWQERRSGSGSFTNISGATTSTLTIENATRSDDDLDVRVVARNGSDRVTSAVATLSVAAGSPPVPVISLPLTTDSYVAGDTIEYAGFATDPDETGNLPDSALTWEVTFQHDDHHHPVLGPVTGESGGSFVVPTIGETSANTWFRIHLTATDSTGLETYIIKEIFPQKSIFKLEANVPGIDLLLDGTPVETPKETLGVVNVQRSIGAPATQTVDGKEYEFVGWSDGGERSHLIFTPSSRTTYTATYREVESGGGDNGGDAEDLLTYFPFNEGTGTTASDSATNGNVNIATLVNGASWTDGINASAIRFDGNNDFAAIADSTDINGRDVSQTTISLWFKADEVNRDSQQVLYKQNGSTRGLNIYLDSGRLYVGGWSDRANWDGTFLSTDDVASGEWHHVALVLDASEDLSSDAIRGYLDGVRFGSGQAATVRTHLGNVSVGGRDQLTRYHSTEDGNGAFAGSIDEVRIYGKPLNDDEVAELTAEYKSPTNEPQNQPPEISSNFLRKIDLPEGELADVANFFASDDEDGESSLNWSVSGTDADYFTIDSRGRLRLETGLFADNPVDGNTDGRYDIDVIVTDSGGLTDSVPVQVTVLERTFPFNIELTNNSVIAVGTDDADTVKLELDDNSHVLTINGQDFSFDARVIDTFHIGAGATAPQDSITVIGTLEDDRARALDNRGEFWSDSYHVHTYTFDTVTFEGSGGTNRAEVFGSNAADTLIGFPENSELRTPSHTYRMLGFPRVDAYGRGGDDRAKVFGTDSSDYFYTFDGYEVLQGVGHYQTTKGFERVDAFGRGGNDTSNLYDTAGDDHLYSFADFTVMQSANQKAVVKGFERVWAMANRGGFDTAYLWDLSSEEQMIAEDETAEIRGDRRRVHASGFDLVDLRANTGEFPRITIDDVAFAIQGYQETQPVSLSAIDDVFAESED